MSRYSKQTKRRKGKYAEAIRLLKSDDPCVIARGNKLINRQHRK